MLRIILLGLLLYCSHFVLGQNKQLKGKVIPNILGYTEDSAKVNVDEYRNNKTVLLNFTATYCGPCWATYKPMNELQEKYRESLEIIVIHLDSDFAKWERLAEKYKVKSSLTSIWTSDMKQDIFDSFQIDGFPYFFLVDKEGIVKDCWFGNNEKKLRKKVERELKTSLSNG